MWVILLEMATYMHFCIQASMSCSSADPNGFLFKQLSTYCSTPKGSSCRNSMKTESGYPCTGNVYVQHKMSTTQKINAVHIICSVALLPKCTFVSHTLPCNISNSHKLNSKQKNQFNAVSIQMPFKLNHSSTPFIDDDINPSISIYTIKFASP